MWEKTNQTNGERPPSRPKTEKRGREERVLWVQTIFCGLILAAALLVRQFVPAVFTDFSKAYLDWLQTGISISQQDKVYRFASKYVENATVLADRLQEAFIRIAAPDEEA